MSMEHMYDLVVGKRPESDNNEKHIHVQHLLAVPTQDKDPD